jgi:hypothetical protein
MAWKKSFVLAICLSSWALANPQNEPEQALALSDEPQSVYSAQQNQGTTELPPSSSGDEDVTPGAEYQPSQASEEEQEEGVLAQTAKLPPVPRPVPSPAVPAQAQAPANPLPAAEAPQSPPIAAPPVEAQPAAPQQPATPPPPAAPAAAAVGGAAPEGCKKLPSDSDWPTKAIWDAELKGWEPIHARGRGRHPQVMYEVKTVASVQRAVRFAAKYNVRLSIVNSGHDFLGRNDAPSGILLDVSGLKGAHLHEQFVARPEGVPRVNSNSVANVITHRQGSAITFGGGMSTAEVNNALGGSGMWTVGAAHGEVTVAGGWGQAGGHGALTHRYGLGADNALEFKVVTAAGDLVVANQVANPDLFWALRGGGGSTFGVVVEATFKAYKMPKVYSYQFFINTTDYNDKSSIYEPAAYFASQIPRIVDEGGMGGYVYMHPNAIRGQLYAPNDYANSNNMKSIMDSVLDRMAAMPGMSSSLLYKYPPWQGGLGGLFGGNGIPPIPGSSATNLGYPLGKVPREPWNPGTPASLSAIGSLFGGFLGAGSNTPSSFDTSFLPESSVERRSEQHEPGMGMKVSRGIQELDSRLFGPEELNHPNLATALSQSMPANIPDGQIRFHIVSGPKVWAQGKDTSVNPAWRRSYAHLLASGGGIPNVQSLRDISPNSGAYINEVRSPRSEREYANFDRLGSTILIGSMTSGVPTIQDYQRSKASGIQTWYSTSLLVSMPTMFQ